MGLFSVSELFKGLPVKFQVEKFTHSFLRENN